MWPVLRITPCSDACFYPAVADCILDGPRHPSPALVGSSECRTPCFVALRTGGFQHPGDVRLLCPRAGARCVRCSPCYTSGCRGCPVVLVTTAIVSPPSSAVAFPSAGCILSALSSVVLSAHGFLSTKTHAGHLFLASPTVVSDSQGNHSHKNREQQRTIRTCCARCFTLFCRSELSRQPGTPVCRPDRRWRVAFTLAFLMNCDWDIGAVVQGSTSRAPRALPEEVRCTLQAPQRHRRCRPWKSARSPWRRVHLLFTWSAVRPERAASYMMHERGSFVHHISGLCRRNAAVVSSVKSQPILLPVPEGRASPTFL